MSSPGVHKAPPPGAVPPPYSSLPPQGAQPGYPPQAPPGYGPYAGPAPAYGFSPPNQTPGYGATVITVQPPTEVVILNGCPNCRSGILQDEFTCLGIFCAIFFFPIGILCCLLTRERRCTNCRSEF